MNFNPATLGVNCSELKGIVSDRPHVNSSMVAFYNDVMSFNDSIVELVCCKIDGSNVSISCGRGLDCAAACYSQEAVLCPSHNCEDCENIEGVNEIGGPVKIAALSVETKSRRWSWATQFSGAMSQCTKRGCEVGGRFRYCCFHPICRKRKRRQCSWLQYLLGESSNKVCYKIYVKLSMSHCRHVLSTSWPDSEWGLEL